MKSLTISLFLLFLFLIQIVGIGSSTNLLTGENQLNNIQAHENKSNTKLNSLNVMNSLSNNFIPAVNGDTARNGSSFSEAIDFRENTIVSNSLQNSSSYFYYRYYALYPYEYVNITLNSSNPGDKIYLFDQFDNFITSNSTTYGLGTFIGITTSQSIFKDKIRFIGWYYIEINGTAGAFQLSFTFVKGDGSSLWDPIQINQTTLTWNGPFKAMENSMPQSDRYSTFYAFYVNSSLPQFTIQLSNIVDIWLYNPDMNFLIYYYSFKLQWIPTKLGNYYLEIGDRTGIGKNLSINVSFQQRTESIGDSFDQPLEIPRSTGLTDILPTKVNPIRFLKLFLYIGENITLNIGNSAGQNYSINIYGPWDPWGTPWITSLSNIVDLPIKLYNVENSGYYVISVSGLPGPYQVNVHFDYMITEGVSWESSRLINLSNQFSDKHYLFNNNSYFYKINFSIGSSLNISLIGTGIQNALVLGKDREQIGVLDNNNEFIIFRNLNTTDYIYIQINPISSQSNYLLSVSKLSMSFSYSLAIDGNLVTFNPRTSKNEHISLVTINLLGSTTTGTITILQSATDENGFFSFVYTKNLPFDHLYLNVILNGPALNLLNYQINHNPTVGLPYILSINLNMSLLPVIHLGQLLVPSQYYEQAHVFTTITRGWLWIRNIDMSQIGPAQITVLYSAFSPGTYYIPFDIVNGRLTKYVIYLIGTNTGDDDGWDDSVFLHEYGHHVEQTYAITNNPGGYHAYSSTISPDFAHGEGFPTFFASQVLDNPIYNDTKSNNNIVYSYDGINLDTGRRLILNNRLEDMYGTYGETSVFALYYDLVESSKSANDTTSSFDDSVTISEVGLFNIFLNFRRENGLGVTNTDELYQGLIETYPNLIDNISKAFYAHGNSFYEYPFVGNTVKNEIVSSSDLQANFTWKLYDSNPKSYQIYVDHQLIKTGTWNFTEEIIELNIHQFNLSVGFHEFTLKINDTLDNQRVYNYTVTILTSASSAGINEANSVPIESNSMYYTFPNKTTYYIYTSKQSELVDLSLLPSISSDFNLSIYDQAFQVIKNYPTVANLTNVYFNYNSSDSIFIVFTYKSGNGSIEFQLKTDLLGYSLSNPANISNSQLLTNFETISNTSYYIRFQTTYTNRIINLLVNSNSIHQIHVLFANATLLKSFTFNQSTKEFNYTLPIDRFVSDVLPYNPFPVYILVIVTDQTPFNGTFKLSKLNNPIFTYTGPSSLFKNENSTLIINYFSSSSFVYNLSINNQSFQYGFLFYNANRTNTLQIPLTELNFGLYVVDIFAIDQYGLLTFYQFSFSIIHLPKSTTEVSSSIDPMYFVFMGTILALSLGVVGIAITKYRTRIMKSSLFKYKLGKQK